MAAKRRLSEWRLTRPRKLKSGTGNINFADQFSACQTGAKDQPLGVLDNTNALHFDIVILG